MGGCCCGCHLRVLDPIGRLHTFTTQSLKSVSPYHLTMRQSLLSLLDFWLIQIWTPLSQILTGHHLHLYHMKHLWDTNPPSVHQQSSGNKIETALQSTNTELVGDTNSGSTLDAKLKNLESDEKMETHIEVTTSKEMEDNNSGEPKKSSEPFGPPLQDEEDVCPTCLEGYDVENPKIITKCDNHFHLACILEWMERSDTCPVCDQEMVSSPTMGGELLQYFNWCLIKELGMFKYREQFRFVPCCCPWLGCDFLIFFPSVYILVPSTHRSSLVFKF